jgi:hypothetical protein
MELHVYRITRSWSAIPIMIVAEDEDHARDFYHMWRHNHAPEQEPEADPIRLGELTAQELQDHPQLAELLDGSRPGVAYWYGHEEGWHISHPEGPVLGQLAPPETPVRYYVFESDDGDDAEVFAMSSEDALLLYYAFHESAFARRPSKVTFNERSRFILASGRPSLLDDMDAGLIGVAGWTTTDGWRIYPPEHEFAGE